ncbi:MAG: 50S ribosomal protein L28 [Deltaproteobacteria bacterium]|nr:50S ribosomal protein L28 [Deltaproteobacteria bacterium]
MAQTCDFCGKNRHKAHKVSHSNIKTRKWQHGQVRRVSACTRCIRSGKVVKAA